MSLWSYVQTQAMLDKTALNAQVWMTGLSSESDNAFRRGRRAARVRGYYSINRPSDSLRESFVLGFKWEQSHGHPKRLKRVKKPKPPPTLSGPIHELLRNEASKERIEAGDIYLPLNKWDETDEQPVSKPEPTIPPPPPIEEQPVLRLPHFPTSFLDMDEQPVAIVYMRSYFKR